MTSPDHSTFSRFRKRLSEKAMTQINSEVLKQFGEKGLSINEGIAIDARLVQSASRPVSSDQLKQLREKRQSDEGKVDKNGKPLKFCRDMESDWVVHLWFRSLSRPSIWGLRCRGHGTELKAHKTKGLIHSAARLSRDDFL